MAVINLKLEFLFFLCTLRFALADFFGQLHAAETTASTKLTYFHLSKLKLLANMFNTVTLQGDNMLILCFQLVLLPTKS